MNKRAILAMTATMAVCIMLGATGIAANLFPPGSDPEPGGDYDELIDQIVAEIEAQGGAADRAEIAAMLTGAAAMGADLGSTTIRTQEDIAANEQGEWCIHECSWDLWVWCCPPVYETHAAIMWDECTKSDLDLYISSGCGGYAVSNADHTLTEEVAVSGGGVNYIWVHAAKVRPYSSYQHYKIAVDCELPKICVDPCDPVC